MASIESEFGPTKQIVLFLTLEIKQSQFIKAKALCVGIMQIYIHKFVYCLISAGHYCVCVHACVEMFSVAC